LAGFFAFQRRFLRDGEAGTAADDEQPFARGKRFYRCCPVGVRGLFEFVRQGLERVLQFAVTVPVGEQVQAEGDGGDEAFGRGDAFFRAVSVREEDRYTDPVGGAADALYQRGRIRSHWKNRNQSDPYAVLLP